MRGMILALAVALLVAGCGGGGSKGGSVAGMPSGGGSGGGTPTTPTRGNPGAVKLETLSPVFITRDYTNVGLAAQGIDLSTLTVRERRSDGVTISAGNASDGVPSTRLGLYQYQVQNPSYQDTSVDSRMLRFRVRPTWRHYGSLNDPDLYSDRIIEFAFDAVRLVNEALPANSKIRVIRDDTMPIGEGLQGVYDWLLSPSREGTIVAFRLDRATWDTWVGSNTLGLAYPIPPRSGTHMHAAMILVPEGIDSTPRGSSTAVHEMLHALGFRGHVSRLSFPDSALKPHAGVQHPVRIMSREDLAALQALYSPYSGGWNSTRQHLYGETEDDTSFFGITWDNAHPYPWAYGITPSGNLPDHAGRAGTATWEGGMLGYSITGQHRRVTGDVDLTVDLSRVYSGQHDLSFDDIRYWDGDNPNPNAPLWRGTGEPVAGELAYKVRIAGTGFDNADRGFTGRGIPNTSSGAVTGSFYGRTYQSMGGTVQRSDLTASFGGSR